MKTRYNFILFVLLSLIAGASYAQKVITTEGTYQLRIEKNISEETAINKAREKAKINAIENAFGTLVFQGNSVYVKDVQSGETTKTDMVFTSIADVLVNGEWLNTIDEKITFNEEDGYRNVKVLIVGKVRELTKIPFTPEVNSLSCNKKTCNTEVFNSGQKLIVYFKAPNNGFVTIYLDDAKQVVRLLPYTKNSESNTFEVKADQEYYFFSNADNKQNNVDEVELYTESAMEQNRLIILYAKTDFNKPILNEAKTNEVNGLKYVLPMSLSSEKFQIWLQKMRSYNKNIEQEIINITIKK
jgi:hypothetical protein